MPPARLLASRRAFTGVLCAALLGGLIEGGWIAERGGWASVPAVVALWMFCVPLGVAAVLAVEGLWRLAPVRAARAGLADPERRPVWLAGGIVAGLGVAAALEGLFIALGIIRSTLANPALLVPIAPIVAGLLLAGVILVGAVLGPPLARLLGQLPISGRAATVVVVFALAAPAILTAPRARFLARDLPQQPIAIAAIALVVALLARRVGDSARRLLAAAVVAAALMPLGLHLYGEDSTLRTAIASGRGLGSAVVEAVHVVVDRDGDGASPWLAGGDCDDGDPDVHPDGVDLPGNSLDEDCDGVDAPVVEHRPRPTLARASLPDGLERRWNLLLVTIDTLRADRLPVYGYVRPTAPNISRLAAEGWVAERAYTPSNSTRYAIPALMAGRELSELEVDWLGAHLYVRPGNALLFERMSAAGWRVEAHLPALTARAMWFGLNAGVAEYRAHPRASLSGFSVEAINRAAFGALRRFEAHGGPWALWVHYLEPHEPYRRHPRYDFGDSPSDRYDGEIAAVDAGLGALVAEVERRGWLDDTVIVVTSDHGEEFGEHGRRYHGKQVYEESVRVPLIIRVPGATPRRIGTPASLIDVAPTVAHLVGLPAGLDYGARSLAGYGAGVEPEEPGRRIYTVSDRVRRWPSTRQVGLLEWPLKAIDGSAGAMLFDLESDPGETRDIAPSDGHPLLAALAAERSRRRLAIRDRLARLTRAEPPSTVDRTGAGVVTSGLRFIGVAPSELELGALTLPRLDAWFRAEPGERADVAFELSIVGEDDAVHLRQRRRPFAGLASTRRWTPGDYRVPWLVRMPRDGAGEMRVQLAARVDGERVWGPVTVARYPAKALR